MGYNTDIKSINTLELLKEWLLKDQTTTTPKLGLKIIL